MFYCLFFFISKSMTLKCFFSNLTCNLVGLDMFVLAVIMQFNCFSTGSANTDNRKVPSLPSNLSTYMQQKGDEPPLDRLPPPRRLHNIIQEIIAPLNLIPKEQIPLRELKILQIQLFHKRQPDNIERCENPTSARILLIRHRFPLDLHLMVEHVLDVFEPSPWQRHLERIISGAHVLRQHILAVRIERVPIQFQSVATQYYTHIHTERNKRRGYGCVPTEKNHCYSPVSMFFFPVYGWQGKSVLWLSRTVVCVCVCVSGWEPITEQARSGF